jgi:hypothetical protein
VYDILEDKSVEVGGILTTRHAQNKNPQKMTLGNCMIEMHQKRCVFKPAQEHGLDIQALCTEFMLT